VVDQHFGSNIRIAVAAPMSWVQIGLAAEQQWSRNSMCWLAVTSESEC
jgi:hypothetical protein